VDILSLNLAKVGDPHFEIFDPEFDIDWYVANKVEKSREAVIEIYEDRLK